MAKEENKKSSFFKRLRHRYRLIVMNDNTFEETFSMQLTPRWVVTVIGTITIIMTLLITSTIIFTPLREYIPGHAGVKVRRELMRMSMKNDSLERVILENNAFLGNISGVLKGELNTDTIESLTDPSINYNKLTIDASSSENELRENIEAEDKYSLIYESETSKSGVSNFSFFTPLKGIVSSSFKNSKEHYGVDILAAENEAIKSTLDGTVILATWSSETGYTISVQHSNNLISVYKHNSVLLKKAGAHVKAGDPISIIGNSGEQTTGPHLHFELWYDGKPIDPQDYMIFN